METAIKTPTQEQAHICSNCSEPMTEGYVDVDDYYCSEYCLIKGNQKQNPMFTMADWDLYCRDNPEYCYYTEWDN